MKRALIMSLLALCICITSACTATSPNTDTPIEITAENLWTEFVSDRDAAREHFDGSQVAVSGVIAETAEAFMGKPCILLENGVVSIPDGIFCYFPNDFDVTQYNVGDTITVLGTCSLAIHVAGDDSPHISIYEASVS